MGDLTDVVSYTKITAQRQNDINDYIHDGTHKLNTLSVDVGGTQVISSDRKVTTSEINTSGDLSVNCGVEKTLTLDKPVWKDINIGSANLTKPVSGQPGVDKFRDSIGADTGIETFAFGIGEKLQGGFEIQHDYKEGSDFYFHVHWQGIAAPTGTDNVQWELKYIVLRFGEVLGEAQIIPSGDTPFDTQYEVTLSNFPAITGTDYVIGDQFFFELTRIAASGDAYAGDALTATMGIHYQVDTLGSRTIAGK
jgi:hypothetical protein